MGEVEGVDGGGDRIWWANCRRWRPGAKCQRPHDSHRRARGEEGIQQMILLL